jgi:hypothetical protein
MKIYDLTESFITEEQQLQELTNLFIAIGENHVILSESTINEAGVWDTIKKTAGGIWRGVKTANDAVNKLGQMAQNTKPVQNFDRKADEIIATIKNKLPTNVVSTIEKYKTWGLNNPKKQTVILAMLGASAALALGPAGGAGVAGVLRFGNELLKGEKASTAIGKSAKGALIGFGAGALFSELGELFGKFDPQTVPGVENISYIRNLANINGRLMALEIYFPDELTPRIQLLWRFAVDALSRGDSDTAYTTIERIRSAVTEFQNPEFLNQIYANNDALRKKALAASETTKATFNAIGSLLQGAITAKTDTTTATNKKQPTPLKKPGLMKQVTNKVKNIGTGSTTSSTPAAQSTQAGTQPRQQPATNTTPSEKDIRSILQKYPQLSREQARKLYNTPRYQQSIGNTR